MKDYQSGKFEDSMDDETKEKTFASIVSKGAVSLHFNPYFTFYFVLDHRTFRTKS